jgi:hypothetical protein
MYYLLLIEFYNFTFVDEEDLIDVTYFTYLHTELRTSWEVANCAAIQKIPVAQRDFQRQGSNIIYIKFS